MPSNEEIREYLSERLSDATRHAQEAIAASENGVVWEDEPIEERGAHPEYLCGYRDALELAVSAMDGLRLPRIT